MTDPANHDPLCPRAVHFRSTYTVCQCHLIKRVELRKETEIAKILWACTEPVVTWIANVNMRSGDE